MKAFEVLFKVLWFLIMILFIVSSARSIDGKSYEIHYYATIFLATVYGIHRKLDKILEKK